MQMMMPEVRGRKRPITDREERRIIYCIQESDLPLTKLAQMMQRDYDVIRRLAIRANCAHRLNHPETVK